jgi:hypothetical protein
MTRAALLALSLATAAAPAAAATGGFAPDPIEMLGFGVICDIHLEGQRGAPETLSGVLNIVDQNRQIDVATTRVPADLGLSFGIRTRMTPGASLPEGAEIVVTHPPMGAKGITVERWNTSLRGADPALNLYTFEAAFEQVQGPWLFQIVAGGKVLLQQGFEVTAPGSEPAVQRACLDEPLSS